MKNFYLIISQEICHFVTDDSTRTSSIISHVSINDSVSSIGVQLIMILLSKKKKKKKCIILVHQQLKRVMILL